MIKTYASNDRYKVTEGYGHYMNKRFEVQEKYSYYENVNGNIKKIESLHTVFHSNNLQDCLDYFNKYKDEPKKDNCLPWIDFEEE